MLEVRPIKRKRRRTKGTGLSARKLSLYAIYLAAAGLLVAGGLVVYNSQPMQIGPNRELISVGQGFIRDAIQGEFKTTFSGDEETRVEPLPNHKFLISGWVDIISEAGDVERRTFSCVIYKDGENWTGEKIAVLPQQM